MRPHIFTTQQSHRNRATVEFKTNENKTESKAVKRRKAKRHGTKITIDIMASIIEIGEENKRRAKMCDS